MSFSVGIRLSVSSSQYLMSISCALQEAYAAMSAASASSVSVYGASSMSSAATAGNSFTASLSGLTAGTTYYYQAYVKVQGTGDGGQVFFGPDLHRRCEPVHDGGGGGRRIAGTPGPQGSL